MVYIQGTLETGEALKWIFVNTPTHSTDAKALGAMYSESIYFGPECSPGSGTLGPKENTRRYVYGPEYTW